MIDQIKEIKIFLGQGSDHNFVILFLTPVKIPKTTSRILGSLAQGAQKVARFEKPKVCDL